MKFDFIASEKAYFPIEFMCRMLGVSPSGYYASRKRPPCERIRKDQDLLEQIHAEFERYPRGCGSRTILGALRAHGHRTSRKRIVRLMKCASLHCRLKRRFVQTTQSKHTAKISPNLVKRSFEPGPVDKVWASDITYMQTKLGWAYLAVVLDVGSRRVVGWSISTSMAEELTLSALRLALETRSPVRGLVHHSDRGVQYASDAYRTLLELHGAKSSMSRKGDCWDNAVVESFFSTLKRELPNEALFEDWRDLERALFAYVEGHYNTVRRHSSLGYLSPNDYERSIVESKRLH